MNDTGKKAFYFVRCAVFSLFLIVLGYVMIQYYLSHQWINGFPLFALGVLTICSGFAMFYNFMKYGRMTPPEKGEN